MKNHAFVSMALAAALLTVGSPGDAKKRPWDVERYTKCLEITGVDQLAPNLIVSSQGCNRGRNPVDSSEGVPVGVNSLAWAAGAKNKENPSLAFVAVAFGTKLDRTSTYVGGSALTSDTGGGLGYRSAWAMVGGKRQELQMSGRESDGPNCYVMRQGNLGARTCSYTEAAMVQLPPELLEELGQAYAADPAATFKFRLETNGGSLTFAIPVAEIEAVRRKIFDGS